MSIEPTPLSLAAVHDDVQAMQQIVDATVLALLDLAELVKPKHEPGRTAFQTKLQDILLGLGQKEEYRRSLLQQISDM